MRDEAMTKIVAVRVTYMPPGRSLRPGEMNERSSFWTFVDNENFSLSAVRSFMALNPHLFDHAASVDIKDVGRWRSHSHFMKWLKSPRRKVFRWFYPALKLSSPADYAVLRRDIFDILSTPQGERLPTPWAKHPLLDAL